MSASTNHLNALLSALAPASGIPPPPFPSHAVTSALLFGLRTRRATDSNSERTASRSCCERGEHFILCARKLGGLTFVPSAVAHLSGDLELELCRFHLRYMESSRLCTIKENTNTSLQGRAEDLDPGGWRSPTLTGRGEKEIQTVHFSLLTCQLPIGSVFEGSP